MALSPEHFQEIYRNTNIGLETAVMLVKPDGTLLVREPMATPKVMGRLKDWSSLWRRMAGGRAGVFIDRSPILGGMRTVAFRHLDGYAAAVVVSVSLDAVMARWFDRLEGYAVYGGAALVALIGLGGLAGELMTNALRHAFPQDRAGVVRIAFHPAKVSPGQGRRGGAGGGRQRRRPAPRDGNRRTVRGIIAAWADPGAGAGRAVLRPRGDGARRRHGGVSAG
ncbi:MAG TPA: hypothetical protein VEB64_01205 [Azospirillaceae bacterium]|nr:hypothetical protein [Azospirillaceae bacterium]